MQPPEKLAEQLMEYESWLRAQPGVNGVGIGVGQSVEPCIKVFTNRISAEVRREIEQRLAEVPLDFEEIGEVRKF